MKKLNKKGFTLIELLAVIVILAIVAAVTMTVIVPMLSSKPGEAAVISVKEINKALNNACSSYGIENNPYGTLPAGVDVSTCQSGTCTITGTSLSDGQALLTALKINGEAPDKYTIYLDHCRVSATTCYSWSNNSSQFKGLKVTGTNESVSYASGSCGE